MQLVYTAAVVKAVAVALRPADGVTTNTSTNNSAGYATKIAIVLFLDGNPGKVPHVYFFK